MSEWAAESVTSTITQSDQTNERPNDRTTERRRSMVIIWLSLDFRTLVSANVGTRNALSLWYLLFSVQCMATQRPQPTADSRTFVWYPYCNLIILIIWLILVFYVSANVGTRNALSLWYLLSLSVLWKCPLLGGKKEWMNEWMKERKKEWMNECERNSEIRRFEAELEWKFYLVFCLQYTSAWIFLLKSDFTVTSLTFTFYTHL